MDIKELKDIISSHGDLESGQVWILKDDSSRIIADQYIKLYALNKLLTPQRIDSYKEIPDEGFVEDTNLYVIYVDELTKPNEYDNCIVLCKSIKNIKGFTEIPELKDWQVIDFAQALVPGVKKEDLEWLMTQYGTSYRAYLNDLDRLSTVKKEFQQSLFEQMLNEGQFSSYTSLNVWDLVNSIIKRDTEMALEVIKHINSITIDPLGLVTSLYKGFKNVLNIQMNNSITAEDLGLNSKQFYTVKKYNCGHYTKEELIKIFSILTDIEKKFKYEGLNINQIIDYLIINILGV